MRFSACLLAISLVACRSARDVADFGGRLTSAAVLERALEIYGGSEAYRSLPSLRQVARLRLLSGQNRGNADFELLFKAPDKLRVKVTRHPNSTQVLVFNGKVARESTSDRVIRDDVTGEAQRRLNYLFPLLLFVPAPEHEERLIGSTPVGDHDVFVLESRASGVTWTAYIAKDTYLLLRLREERSDRVIDTYYSDYRPIAGRPMAHRFITVVGGQKVQEGELVQAEVGLALDDNTFELKTPAKPSAP